MHRRAAFRCPGARCRGHTAHCDRHRVEHPQEPDLAYCPDCFADGFPTCTVRGCRNVGAVPCEMTDDRLQRCGVRMCAMHLSRWQVYGVERLGLALCEPHRRSLPAAAPQELLRRIVAGTFLRGPTRRDAEPLPSLQALAHTLRNQGHLEWALDYPLIHHALLALADGFGGAQAAAGIATMMRERDASPQPPGSDQGRRLPPRARSGWQAELATLRKRADVGEQLVRQVQALVRKRYGRDGEALAAALQLGEYKRPREIDGVERPGLLFLRVPAGQQHLFRQARAYLEEQLSLVVSRSIRVDIESGDRRNPAGRRPPGHRPPHDGKPPQGERRGRGGQR
jgi:hypothetical protein